MLGLECQRPAASSATGLRRRCRPSRSTSSASEPAYATSRPGPSTPASSTRLRALCWGENRAGQLGDATYTDRNAPREVFDLPRGVPSLALGAANTIALMEDGRVYYWGRDGSRMVCFTGYCVPEPNSRTRPRLATFLPRDFTRVAAERGGGHDLTYNMCGLQGAGTPVCWGGDFDGYGGEDDVHLTSPAGLSTPIVSLSLGGDQSGALVGAGVMECWGRNDHGQSGRGTVSPYPAFYLTPQPVLGGATWAAVTSGWRHVCGPYEDRRREVLGGQRRRPVGNRRNVVARRTGSGTRPRTRGRSDGAGADGRVLP